MKKYQEFENFIANLQQNESAVVAKLAAAQTKVTMFQREFDNAAVMVPACQSQISELSEKLKIDPINSELSAEKAIWVTRLKEYGDRADTLKAALESSKVTLAELEKEHTDLDPTELAEEATVEMRDEIKKQYGLFIDAINEALAARLVYLAAINKVNSVRNTGRNITEAAKKAASYAKVNNLGQIPGFDTGEKQFLIESKDVRNA